MSFHRECNTSTVGNIRSQYVYTASVQNQYHRRTKIRISRINCFNSRNYGTKHLWDPSSWSRKIKDEDVDMDVPNLSKDIPKRIKHYKRHAKADTVPSITDGWRDALFRDRQEEICSIGDFYHELDHLWKRERHNKLLVFAWVSFDVISTATSSRADYVQMCKEFRKLRDAIAVNGTQQPHSHVSYSEATRTTATAAVTRLMNVILVSWPIFHLIVGLENVLNFNATFFLCSDATSVYTEIPVAVLLWRISHVKF